MNVTKNPAAPLRLYRAALSGHCHRVQLFLSILGLPHDLIDVNLGAGEHKRPEFLRLNPFGQIPVLQDGADLIADSNAILVYLASKYAADSWYPSAPLPRANVQRWLSAAAGPLAHGAAAARIAVLFNQPVDTSTMIERAHALLTVMDSELIDLPFVAARHVTIADLALYSYTAHAPEGNVSLERYANVQDWLTRVEALPGFVPMTRSNIGLRATG